MHLEKGRLNTTPPGLQIPVYSTNLKGLNSEPNSSQAGNYAREKKKQKQKTKKPWKDENSANPWEFTLEFSENSNYMEKNSTLVI